MTVQNWNTTFIDGEEFLVIDVAKFRIPLEWDPSSNMFLAVAVPDGGLGNFPALVQGDPGVTPNIDNVVNLTVLEWNDPTPEFASFSETSPDVYELNLGLRNGAPGDDGTLTILGATDLAGTPTYKKIMQVNAAADGMELVPRKIGDRFFPATINNTPSGNAAFTLCTVGVPTQEFDWRPEVSGQCIVTGTATDVRADLIVRMGTTGISTPETSGNIVGRCFDSGELSATSHIHPTLVLSTGPPAGSADTYDKVLAGNTATFYLRVERQSGTETFTTTNTTTRFWVKVNPIP